MSKARGAENRHDLPRDPAAVLRLLRGMRNQLAKVKEQVTIQGPIYRGIEAVSTKIDDLAQWLTGEKAYFSRDHMSNTAQPEALEHWRRWDAIERGDEPWPEEGKPR